MTSQPRLEPKRRDETLDHGWLVDNNVPRSVTILLGDLGEDAIEVRAALAHDAPDDAVVAYAAAQNRILVTHDLGCARLALAKGVPHLWLRTREWQDRDRLRDAFPDVITRFELGVARVRLFATVVR